MLSKQTLDIAPISQMPLWIDGGVAEDPAFLTKQLLTYIGNKRTLLGPIAAAVEKTKGRLGKNRLRILDAFSGSGVVSRYLKSQASLLISNDIEDYAAVVGRCYLQNSSNVNWPLLLSEIADLNERVGTVPLTPGFIEQLYAPRDEDHIIESDRVFYTKENARRLDNYRRLIEGVSPEHKDLVLAPLLSEASIHANTAGVFKGFYKSRVTKLGQYGGTNGDALSRITTKIILDPPILSRYECDVLVLRQNANDTVKNHRDLDLVYIDPPYNQHPYGANYFMLNLLVHYQRPEHISKVSGIPTDWRRSDYNVRSRAFARFRELVHTVDASFLLVSFNNEGFISPQDMLYALKEIGHVEVFELPYNTFRGSRNLRARDIHVTEQLFLVERK